MTGDRGRTDNAQSRVARSPPDVGQPHCLGARWAGQCASASRTSKHVTSWPASGTAKAGSWSPRRKSGAGGGVKSGSVRYRDLGFLSGRVRLRARGQGGLRNVTADSLSGPDQEISTTNKFVERLLGSTRHDCLGETSAWDYLSRLHREADPAFHPAQALWSLSHLAHAALQPGAADRREPRPLDRSGWLCAVCGQGDPQPVFRTVAADSSRLVLVQEDAGALVKGLARPGDHRGKHPGGDADSGREPLCGDGQLTSR